MSHDASPTERSGASEPVNGTETEPEAGARVKGRSVPHLRGFVYAEEGRGRDSDWQVNGAH